jgi:hypothetical protein
LKINKSTNKQARTQQIRRSPAEAGSCQPRSKGFVVAQLPSDRKVEVERGKRRGQQTTCLGATATEAIVIRAAREDNECVMRQQTDSATMERSGTQTKCLGGSRAAVLFMGDGQHFKVSVKRFFFFRSVHCNMRALLSTYPAVHCRPFVMTSLIFSSKIVSSLRAAKLP